MNKLPDLKTGINDKLKEVSPNLDLLQAPPINQKRLVTFLNHFLINTVDFLNKFSKHCTYKLFTLDQKINRIEAQLCLLESKLNSVPEVADSKDVNVELPKPEEIEIPKPSEDNKENEVSTDTEVKEKVETPQADEVDPPKEPEPENPELVKYRKMIQVGVPLQAVKIKMQIEGLDPNLLDT
ncbi:WASH complex subunit 3 [Halyomorpha halys]|uniref:WASH complex subunit 3 n=1 Tax=Halyomorpha halys TaxID=286706 RepID=UPI0006D4E4CE|nr:WASH complex subunit 3 [Halyomorpha halys]